LQTLEPGQAAEAFAPPPALWHNACIICMRDRKA
jgi:hypothetical protein